MGGMNKRRDSGYGLPKRFINRRELRAWLRRHPEGRRILIDLVAEETWSREKVLVLLRSDGWVDVYGSVNTDVCVAVVPHAETSEGAIGVERLLEDQLLPRPYRGMIAPHAMPGKLGLRASGQCERMTIGELLGRLEDVLLVRGIMGRSGPVYGKDFGVVK